VSAEFAKRLVTIDPTKGRVVDVVPIGNRPKGLVVAEDGVLVAVQASGRGHRGGRLVVLSGYPDSIDPAIGNSPSSVPALNLVYDGLTGFRRVGGSEGTQLVPNLARKIPTPRDGGRTYTFRLRPGIRYANGGIVQPEDFRRALERLFELGAPRADIFANVVGAERCAKGRRCDLSRGGVVTRGDSVTFHLSEPLPFFLNEVSGLRPIPPGTPSTDVGTKPVPGTGPYMIESYVPARQLKLTRNPGFRVWSEAARPDGNADEIVFRVVPGNDDRLVSDVARGRADISSFPTGRTAELRRRYASQLRLVPEQATVYFFMNTKRPPFDDIRVRRALNYAIDRRRVVELHGGTAVAQSTCQLVPPTIAGYVRYCPYTLAPRRSGEWTAPDLARAQQLIAASGSAGQEVTVWTFSYFAKEGRYVVSLLSRLGYRARLKEVNDLTTYFAAIDDPKTQAQSGIAGAYGLASATFELEAMTCGYPQNYAKFCDRELDRQFRRSLELLETDPGAAARMWARSDRQLVDQAPWVPLYTPRTPYFVSKRVGNWQYHPYNFVLLDQLWVR
jgi:peptide/nickel transport system substrate-binding protein